MNGVREECNFRRIYTVVMVGLVSPPRLCCDSLRQLTLVDLFQPQRSRDEIQIGSSILGKNALVSTCLVFTFR